MSNLATKTKYPRYVRTKRDREEFDRKEKLPFKSKYHRLRYCARGAFGDPRFPWVTTFAANPKLNKTGHTSRQAAQAHATGQDKYIDVVIDALGFNVVCDFISYRRESPKSLKVGFSSIGKLPDVINTDTMLGVLSKIVVLPGAGSEKKVD